MEFTGCFTSSKQHKSACVENCAAALWLLEQVTCCKVAPASSYYTAVVALLSCNNSVKENSKKYCLSSSKSAH